MKKRRIALMGIIMLAALAAAVVWMVPLGYPGVLKANWGIELPRKVGCVEKYEKDSGASFHGDGIRYHVFEGKNAEAIDGMLEWTQFEREKVLHERFRKNAENWLDQIEVPTEERPDYENCAWYQVSQEDGDKLLMFWNRDVQKLYIAEFFL